MTRDEALTSIRLALDLHPSTSLARTLEAAAEHLSEDPELSPRELEALVLGTEIHEAIGGRIRDIPERIETRLWRAGLMAEHGDPWSALDALLDRLEDHVQRENFGS